MITGLTPSTQRTITLGTLGFDAGALGVAVRGLRLQGWDGSPASSVQVTQRLRAPGGYASANPQLGARSLTLTGTIVGPDSPTVVNACDELKAAVTLDPTTLTVDGDGVGARSMTVQRQGEVLIANTPTQRIKQFSIGLVAPDPRKLGYAQTLSTALPSTTGGISVPLSVPFTITSTVVTGQVTANNPGNISGPVQVRISGPAPSGGIVTHTSPLGTSVFAVNLPLGDGEWVDVDMENETVLAQGQSSRSQWITSRGFAGFDPGDNAWSFSAPSGTAATLSVTPTPAWE